MKKILARIQAISKKVGNFIAALMLATMFCTFLIQIVSRYSSTFSLGWTVELCLVLWLWLVFWGGSFTLDERDHITFDLLSAGAGRRTSRVLNVIGAIVMLIGIGFAYLPTLDYIDFLSIKPSPTLSIRLNWLFSIFMVFLTAVFARYAFKLVWLARDLVRGGSTNTDEN